MEEIQFQFNQLEVLLLDVLENQVKLKEEKNILISEIKNKENAKNDFLNKIHFLEEENKKLKVVSAISGNQEYKKLMKLQLNKLVKEIDLCIAQIKSN